MRKKPAKIYPLIVNKSFMSTKVYQKAIESKSELKISSTKINHLALLESNQMEDRAVSPGNVKGVSGIAGLLFCFSAEPIRLFCGIPGASSKKTLNLNQSNTRD